MATGTLIIVRPRQYADFLRRYRIILDGNKVGTIKAGQELRLEVPAGEHEVVAKIDWTGSNKLSFGIREGETTQLEVGTNVSGWRLLIQWYYALFGDYLYLRHRVRAFPIVPR